MDPSWRNPSPKRVNDGAINHNDDAFPITVDVQAQDNSPENIQNKKLMEDAMQLSNPSGQIEDTKLSATDELLNMKAKHKWSDKSFNELLQLIKEILPEKNTSLRREMEELKLTFSKSGTQVQSSTYHGTSSQAQDDSPC
ncbi:hypothetical protein CKAN_02600800 [Cinnamomum micranthum f. kanehirae]|uniref:Uncharacterized protein n=1 Tax=Cinnamomum micranthum f. kanehirae TaxID=337451 RepID=A0A443Q0S0_9MAGN|nr:hypothetical protein CKAN_02600800 [Cinnamomum micranthum f. kanehirae]